LKIDNHEIRCGEGFFFEQMLVPSFRSQRQKDQHLLNMTQGLLSTCCQNGGGYLLSLAEKAAEKPTILKSRRFSDVLEQLLKK
jgi:hypothetical protein